MKFNKSKDGSGNPLEREQYEACQAFIHKLPLLPPEVIAEKLEQLGYKGQQEQRQSLSLMAYRHVRRLKRIYLEGEHRNALPPKQNLLMLGPTGCGKTYLVELLFQHIFKLPTVMVDITSFTESGYIGDDVRTILTRLIINADGNRHLAGCGIVCLDEFDKLASSSSNARFAGQGTTKDVSGYGVQRELLAMLQGADVLVAMDYGFSAHGARMEISTADIPFIACGAFSGIEELLKRSSANIGFHVGNGSKENSELYFEEVGAFQKYGFLPELIGRFSRVVRFPKLSKETLRQILMENILPQFKNEFKGEGLKLKVTDAAMEHIIKQSDKRGTGARGLQIELVSALERAAFQTFMRVQNAEVTIDLNNGHLESDINKL
jgi:ATP-dependent Clp protease ATP-binding subunit ClpX